MIKVFLDTLLCKAPGAAVYWFFWMMLAMYIIMPILNKWIRDADLSKVECLLIVWAIYVLLVHSLMLPIPEYVSFVISPIGYVVLGYYLRYTERKIFSSSLIAWILIIVPAILMFAYSYSVVNSNILFIFHRYSIPVMLIAIGAFCLFKTSKFLDDVPESFKNIITSISICSYGMYLIHSQMIMVVRKILHLSFNFTFDYIILFLTGFVLSWIIIYILAKIPIIDEFIGVK